MTIFAKSNPVLSHIDLPMTREMEALVEYAEREGLWLKSGHDLISPSEYRDEIADESDSHTRWSLVDPKERLSELRLAVTEALSEYKAMKVRMNIQD